MNIYQVNDFLSMPQPHANSKNTILLVSVDRRLILNVKNMLHPYRVNVHSFENPLLAIDHFTGQFCESCSIVFSDIRMPNMTGFELVRKLKQLNPVLKTILMTEFTIDKEEFVKVFPTIRVDGLILKPFNVIEIIRIIKENKRISNTT